MQRSQMKGFMLVLAGWIGAAELFVLIRYFGLASIPQFQGLDLSRIQPAVMLGQGAIIGLVLGIAYFLLDRAMDTPSIRRRSYGVLILIQAAGNIAFIVIALLLVTTFEALRGEIQGGWASISC